MKEKLNCSSNLGKPCYMVVSVLMAYYTVHMKYDIRFTLWKITPL